MLLAEISPETVLALVGGILMVIAAAHLLITWRRWTRPLRELSAQAGRLAQGNWQGRLQCNGRPAAPVRQLQDHLNELVELTRRRLGGLEHEQADLHALVDTLPDPILAADKQGRLILMNTPAARLLRLSPEQALSQKVVSVINDEAIVELFEEAAAVGGGALIQREVRLLRAGQKVIYEAVSVRTAGGGALVVLRDITALAGAVQMKTDFVANASHELRTPITAIKIAFETLREAFDDDRDQALRCMTVIDGHLGRLEEMLRDLLDLSSVEEPQREPTVAAMKTADVLETVRATIQPFARQKGVELQTVDNGPQRWHSDPRLVNLILKNLVENSVKYTPEKGRVTVTVSAGDAEGGQEGESGEGRAILLTVADTGIGIAPEHIDRVFERFYQVDPARSGSAGRGTGLGLAIVKHAVLALGGTVELQSRPGEGTTVTCTLPQPEGVEMPAEDAAEAEAASLTPGGSGIKSALPSAISSIGRAADS